MALVEEIAVCHNALLKNRCIVFVVHVNVAVLRFQVVSLRGTQGFVGNARQLFKLEGDRRVASGEVNSERTRKRGQRSIAAAGRVLDKGTAVFRCFQLGSQIRRGSRVKNR
jgi:hypothetical protein